MEFTVKQSLAWVLIIIGLGLVFWDIFSSYLFFTAQKDFPQVFVPKATVESVAPAIGNSIQDQMVNAIKEQMNQAIPENSPTELLNIASWITFASFILWAGGKLVGIGNEFLKDERHGEGKNNRRFE